jgi:hypothetical protein
MARTVMSADRQTRQSVAEREVVDENGISWRVTEMRVWDLVGRRSVSLIAANKRGFRRLWNYPAGWADLPDAELAALVNKPVSRPSRAS